LTLRYNGCDNGLGADGGDETIPTSSSVERESMEMRNACQWLNLIRLDNKGNAVNITVEGVVRQSLPSSASDKGDLLRRSHPRAVDAHPFILPPPPLPPPPETWPQWRILLRPTPGSGTNIRGVRRSLSRTTCTCRPGMVMHTAGRSPSSTIPRGPANAWSSTLNWIYSLARP
jgi:hypothetical protein